MKCVKSQVTKSIVVNDWIWQMFQELFFGKIYLFIRCTKEVKKEKWRFNDVDPHGKEFCNSNKNDSCLWALINILENSWPNYRISNTCPYFSKPSFVCELAPSWWINPENEEKFLGALDWNWLVFQKRSFCLPFLAFFILRIM